MEIIILWFCNRETWLYCDIVTQRYCDIVTSCQQWTNCSAGSHKMTRPLLLPHGASINTIAHNLIVLTSVSSIFLDLEQSISQYCSSHENVLEWLLDVEDRLSTMEKVSEKLDQIKIQFQVHSDYMQYLDSNQEEIGKVCGYMIEYVCFWFMIS